MLAVSWLAVSAGCALLAPAPPEPEPFLFFPGPPEQPRIQHLVTYRSEGDIAKPPSSFERFVLGEREYRELRKPYGIALHGDQLFVCDTRMNAVVVFDLKLGSMDFLGAQDPGRLRKPVNIAVTEDGTRYVADTGFKRVMIYDASNAYVGHLGHPDVWSPTDVAIQGDRLYATDRDHGEVVVVDLRTGQEIDRFGDLFFPTNLAVDGEGNVYVAETGAGRVMKFGPKGRELQQFGSLGRRLGQFVRPKGVAVDRDGRLYVIDAAFENIQIFDPEGRLLLPFGRVGNVPGGLNLPAKIHISYDSLDLYREFVAPGYELEYVIFVTSQFGANKINVFGFLKAGETADEPDSRRRSRRD